MNGEKNTFISISSRELIIGGVGALLSGVLVWLFTENIRLTAVIKAQEAVEAIRPDIDEALRLSDKAITEADRALFVVKKASKEVDVAHREVQKIITNLKATPLFEKVESSMDELREVAKNEAHKVATENLPEPNIKTYPITKIYKTGEFVVEHDIEDISTIVNAFVLYRDEGVFDRYLNLNYLRPTPDKLLGSIHSMQHKLISKEHGKTELVVFFAPK